MKRGTAMLHIDQKEQAICISSLTSTKTLAVTTASNCFLNTATLNPSLTEVLIKSKV